MCVCCGWTDTNRPMWRQEGELSALLSKHKNSKVCEMYEHGAEIEEGAFQEKKKRKEINAGCVPNLDFPLTCGTDLMVQISLEGKKSCTKTQFNQIWGASAGCVQTAGSKGNYMNSKRCWIWTFQSWFGPKLETCYDFSLCGCTCMCKKGLI